MGLVRVLPCAAYHMQMFHPRTPGLYFRIPDDVATRKYGQVAPVLKAMLRRIFSWTLWPPRFRFRGRRAFVFGRVAVANASSSDKFMSGQLYCMKFSYEIGSPCMGRYDRWGD
ncbi:unnamed protein product [Ascophyllum nodosum]